MNTQNIKRITAAVSVLALTLIAAPTASAATSTDPTVTQMLQAVAIDEKLAYDLYTTLGDEYDSLVFNRIASSELKHQAAVRKLMDRYNITDPTAGLSVGVFPTQVSQNLYDTLVAEGLRSEAQAAGVGVTIEKVDIRDLESSLDAALPYDVERVFNNLLRGSENHLAAFSATATGESPNANCPQGGPKNDGNGRGHSKGPRR